MCFISITKIRLLKYTSCMTFVIFIVSYYSWSCDTKMKSWCFCRHICRHALPAKLCNKKYKRVLLSVYLSFTENVFWRTFLSVSYFSEGLLLVDLSIPVNKYFWNEQHYLIQHVLLYLPNSISECMRGLPINPNFRLAMFQIYFDVEHTTDIHSYLLF